MKIDREEARRIAGLAHLEFDDSSLDRIAGEMTEILGYVERLRDASGLDSDAGAATPMRDDVTTAATGRELIERNAPAFDNGFFVVPKVIE